MDDAVSARIDALKAKCDALTAEVSWLKAANAAVASRAVGTSPSAGRKRARVEDPPSLEEELITTTDLLELRNAVRGLEEREAAREPLSGDGSPRTRAMSSSGTCSRGSTTATSRCSRR